MNPTVIIAFFIIVNVCSYLIMHTDKNNARLKKRRISEASLFSFAIFGGSIGILVAMYLLRHKTRKLKFKLGIPLILILQVLAILLFSYRFL